MPYFLGEVKIADTDGRRYAALKRIKIASGFSSAQVRAAERARASIREQYHFVGHEKLVEFARRREQADRRQGSLWTKPKPPAGTEWRQCYKPTCACMKGGRWHGPYAYRKKRERGHVKSVYKGKYQ